MVKVVHFGASGPSAEGVFSQISKEVEAKSAMPEMQNIPHEVIVKETLKSIAERLPEQHETGIPTQPIATTPQEPAVEVQGAGKSTLPAYLNSDGEQEIERQAVEALIKQTFDKGLDEAIRAAKRYDPFIEDAFHDALTEQLVPELRRRGILK